MRPFHFIAALSACLLALAMAPAAETAPATIRVTLPADATLTVDGQATKSTSGTRWFTTPALESGRKYSYTFKASFVRDGKTVTVEQKVPVVAGQQSVVSLEMPGRAFVAGPASYYYSPPARPIVVNYYYTPPYFGDVLNPAWNYQSEWSPGNYKIYNP